jgi:acetoin utilization deacetylase AcuC-like enzyme
MPAILYCPSTEVALPEYGIEIPLSANRRLQIITYLKQRWGIKYQLEKSPRAYNRDELLLVHKQAYVDQLYDAPEKAIIETFELIDKNGRPHRFNPTKDSRPLGQMVQLHLAHARGTFHAMELALEKEWCFYAGGGMHHAMSFGGRGFCLVNDIMLGLSLLKQQEKINQAWVIDVDAHKGDGTAELAQHLPWLKTLSIHMQDGWPLDGGTKDDAWFIPSTIDIPMGQGEDHLYLARLKNGLEELKLSAKKMPDIAVVVLGADPWEGDILPSTALMKLSSKQMLERDLMLHNFLRSQNIPTVYIMAGGYGPESWTIYAQFLDILMA